MSAVNYQMHIAREQHKISCAHMTVFPDGSKERLHGHNYSVAVALTLASIRFADMIAFSPVKAAIAALCAEWKERVLVATRNPHFVLLGASDGVGPDEYGFRLCGQRYILPAQDVLALPLDNIAVEPLAEYIAHRLVAELAITLPPTIVTSFEVTVEETPGQGASCKIVR